MFFLFFSFSTVLQYPFCTIGLFCRQDGELYAFLPLVPADKNLKHNPLSPTKIHADIPVSIYWMCSIKCAKKFCVIRADCNKMF